MASGCCLLASLPLFKERSREITNPGVVDLSLVNDAGHLFLLTVYFQSPFLKPFSLMPIFCLELGWLYCDSLENRKTSDIWRRVSKLSFSCEVIWRFFCSWLPLRKMLWLLVAWVPVNFAGIDGGILLPSWHILCLLTDPRCQTKGRSKLGHVLMSRGEGVSVSPTLLLTLGMQCPSHC